MDPTISDLLVRIAVVETILAAATKTIDSRSTAFDSVREEVTKLRSEVDAIKARPVPVSVVPDAPSMKAKMKQQAPWIGLAASLIYQTVQLFLQ